MWPSSTTPPLTPLFIVMASPLPYSKMISEATCDTISDLGLIKLSSEFSILASPHATQSTSSEDYQNGVVSARPYSEYLSLILFTNSEPNSRTCVTFTATQTTKEWELEQYEDVGLYKCSSESSSNQNAVLCKNGNIFDDCLYSSQNWFLSVW